MQGCLSLTLSATVLLYVLLARFIWYNDFAMVQYSVQVFGHRGAKPAYMIPTVLIKFSMVYR